MSQESFADLGVSAPVVAALAKRDIHDPFPIQALVIPDALDGVDVLAKSRTGSGKTLAFALAVVERVKADDATPAAVILTPTRELAVQVADEFVDVAKVKGLRVATAYGGVGIPGRRWCSCGRSAAPTVWCASSSRTASRLRRCTATCARARGSRR